MRAATALFTLSLAALGTTYALPSGSGPFSASLLPRADQCSAGQQQCCNNVQDSGSPDAQDALGPLAIALKDLNVPVGLACSPINAGGAGSGGNWYVLTLSCI